MSLNRDILFIGVDGGDRNFNTVTLTGSIFLAPGTVTNPALTFANDRNTGIYNPAQDVLGIAAGGVESVWFYATAWVGLNTLTGGIQLNNVTDTVTNYERLEIKASSNTFAFNATKAGTGTLRNLVFQTGGTTILTLDTSQNATFIGIAKAPTFATTTGTPAVGGVVRLSNNNGINWRNAGNSADIGIYLDASNIFQLQAGFGTSGLLALYNNITTVAWGAPAIYGTGRATGQTALVASVATYTVGAADGSFIISANVNVTTSTTHSFTITCAYTDEGNTPRTLTLSVSQLTGTFITAITNVTGTGPYEGIPVQIRCKAATAITVATAGTFTSVTYNVEANIMQVK